MSFAGGLGGIAHTQYLIVRILADTSGLQNSLAKLNGQLKGMTVGQVAVAGLGHGMTLLTRSVAAAAVTGAVLENQFIKIQDAQAAMARTLETESAPALAAINEEILELSKTIPLSVTELYRIAEVAGTIGIAGGEIAEFTDTVAKMAATTDLSADEAAMGLGRLLNLFGFVNEKGEAVADNADNIASAMLKLSVSQASTDQQILKASQRFAALATNMGLLPPQILAISSAAAALGQAPEAVGGALQGFFQRMNRAIAEGGTKLEGFGKVAGMTGKEFKALAQTDPFAAFVSFLEGFNRLTPDQQSLLFGTGKQAILPFDRRMAQTIQGLSSRVSILKSGAAAATEAYNAERLLDEQSQVRFNTLKNNLQLLVNAIAVAGFRFGDAFDEELGGAIKRLTEYINENEDVFIRWGQAVGRFIEGINWSEVGRVVERIVGVVTTATGVVLEFIRLFPEIAGGLATLKGLDILTGGGVGFTLNLATQGLTAAFGNALLKTGVGKLFVQPVFVTNQVPGVPGAAGAAAGLGSQLATLGLIGALVANLAQLPTAIDGAVKTIQSFFSPSGQVLSALRDGLLTLAEGLKFNPFNFLLKPEIIDELLRPTPRPIDTRGVLWGSDLHARNVAEANRQAAFEVRDAADSLGNAAGLLTEAAEKWLDTLKPKHREGEIGKSLESRIFARIPKMDPNTPNFASKLGEAIDHLVDHYTKQPIGTKGHPRSFVVPELNQAARSMAQTARQLLRRGRTEDAQAIINQLKKLDDLPNFKLPPGIRRLIARVAENDQTQKETRAAVNRTKNAVNELADRTSGRLGEVRRAIAAKRLAVKVAVGGTKVNTGNVIVNNRVSATIGARSVVRSSRSVAYGPTYTSGGTSTYSPFGSHDPL